MISNNDWDEEELGRLDHWIWLFSDILQLLLVVFGVGLLAASFAGLELTTLAAEVYIAVFMLFIYIFLKIGYRYAIIRQSIKERVYWVRVSVSSVSAFALLLIGSLLWSTFVPKALGILYVSLVMILCGLSMVYLYHAKGSNFIDDWVRQAFCGSEVQWKKVSRNLKYSEWLGFIPGISSAIGLWFLIFQSAGLVAEGEWLRLAMCLVPVTVMLLVPYYVVLKWKQIENVSGRAE